jgi:hypothetical protein
MANTWNVAFGEYLRPLIQSTYIGLILSNGNEVNGGNYSRIKCDNWVLSEDTDYIYLTNQYAISFPIATTDWATESTYPITHVGLFGTLSDNSLLGKYTLSVNRYCYAGDQIIIPIGSHKIYFNKNL